MTIYSTFKFDSGHHLPNVPQGHKCGNRHGHTYRLVVYVDGSVDPASGWIIDYADIKRAIAPVLQQIDHRYLNDVFGLENPTTENLCRWLWPRLLAALPNIVQIEVKESSGTGCIYEGE